MNLESLVIPLSEALRNPEFAARRERLKQFKRFEQARKNWRRAVRNERLQWRIYKAEKEFFEKSK